MTALPTGVDPFTSTAVTLLEKLQQDLSKQWDPVLDVFRLMLASPLPTTPDVDALPPIEHYPPRDVMHLILRDILWTLSSAVAEHEPDLPMLLRTISLVYQLYSGRTVAAFKVNEFLVLPAESAEDFSGYMQPVNRVANILFGVRGTSVFYSNYPYIPQFVTRQLTSVVLHRMNSGQTERTFFVQFRRRQLSAWLGLLYETLDPKRPLNLNINPVTVLTVAERMVTPAEGQRLQFEWAAALVERGDASVHSVDGLSPEQLFALRTLHGIWPATKNRCLVCRRKLGDEKPASRRKCRQCHRMLYCSKDCQTTHWEESHREMCEVWFRINARMEEPRIQAEIAALPTDFRALLK